MSHQPLRVLCADDNLSLVKVMVEFLTNAGYAVESAGDGLEAWAKVGEDIGYFDIIVTDHRMPELSGLELVELLRQARYPGVIVVHASDLSDDEQAAYRELGIGTIVGKSSGVAALLAAMRAATRS